MAPNRAQAFIYLAAGVILAVVMLVFFEKRLGVWNINPIGLAIPTLIYFAGWFVVAVNFLMAVWFLLKGSGNKESG